MTVFRTLIIILLFVAVPATASNYCRISIINSKGQRISLKAEVVSTPEARNRGLMFRRKLSQNHGMLFVFFWDQNLAFWMKNTYIPLSIAYIDKNGVIKEIHTMAPFDTTPILSRSKMRYALEMNQGWFKQYNITTGAKVYLRGCIGK